MIDLDIDEVSVVDRGANQHSLIAFSKSLLTEGTETLEESMPEDILVFNEAGQEVEVEALEHGETVFDQEGNEYVFVEDGAEGFEDSDDDFDEEVGKAYYTNMHDVNGAAYDDFLTEGASVANEPIYKSLGDSVIEELSKAVSDSERDQIVAKALNEVEIFKAEAEEARAWAQSEHDARVTEAFISKAEEYNLPVAPAVFGPILKAVAEVLDEEQLDILDEILCAVGDALYEEIGYIGESSNSSVLDQVNAMVNESVGKSDFSSEQMTTAMFVANPAAYDAYLAEIGR